MWNVIMINERSWHVTPIDDLKVHNTLSDHCQCLPRVDYQPNGNRIVVHNAYDGREFWEQDESLAKIGEPAKGRDV